MTPRQRVLWLGGLVLWLALLVGTCCIGAVVAQSALRPSFDGTTLPAAVIAIAASVGSAYLLTLTVMQILAATTRHTIAVLDSLPGAKLVKGIAQLSVATALTLTPTAQAGATPDVPVLRHIGPATPSASAMPDAGTFTAPSESGPRPATSDTHTVRSGENLWVIAEDVLRARSGAAPSAAELHRYWARMIEDNKASFPQPDNPDLIRTGQVLRLPN